MDTPDRFAFGLNWQSFLQRYSPERLEAAKRSLSKLLGRDDMQGIRFLDAGSGSGLFSAAAFAMGATVASFDFDPDSVRATQSLRPEDSGARWRVSQGSLLDEGFMASLGQFDVAYCWGVAHHTGNMYRALDLLAKTVRPGGTLAIAIYNDQGNASKRWAWVKRNYQAHRWMRPFLVAGSWIRLWAIKCVADLLKGKPMHRWRRYTSDLRGMSASHDLLDWVGGYPFEVAKPEEIFEFHRVRGYLLEAMTTRAGGIGCNEFVFKRQKPSA